MSHAKPTDSQSTKNYVLKNGLLLTLVLSGLIAVFNHRRATANDDQANPAPDGAPSKTVTVNLDKKSTQDTLLELGRAYLITFGWAIVGSVSMGLGIVIALKMFTLSTRRVDEWELIKQGNIAMSIILSALIISLGLVVASITRPQ